jgi:hypothetical protein
VAGDRAGFARVFRRPVNAQDLSCALARYLRTVQAGNSAYDRFAFESHSFQPLHSTLSNDDSLESTRTASPPGRAAVECVAVWNNVRGRWNGTR